MLEDEYIIHDQALPVPPPAVNENNQAAPQSSPEEMKENKAITLENVNKHNK